MSDRSGDDPLYPNRGEETGPKDVSRRRLLAGSAVAGAAASAGCSSRLPGGEEGGSSETVFVFNTGDLTVSIIDAAADELVTTQYLGATASFPSNQFAPSLTDSPEDVLWLNVDDGVRAMNAASLSEDVAFETGSGANWQEVTPDGEHLVVSAREPVHKQFKLDADPASDSFGEVVAEIDRKPEGGRGDSEGPGPCDVSILPDGSYAFVPDIYADTLSVIDVDSFEIVNQVSVSPVDGADAVRPWMDTVDWNGDRLLVENNEGETGTESIWDVSDPTAPEEVVRLTGDDGLGKLPLTSEIGPDSEVGYVFTAESNDVTVIDLAAGEVTDRLDLGGSAFVGTWGPNREKLYVPVQTSDEVKIIDHEAGEITGTISVGSKPYGATAGTVRPEVDAAANFLAMMSKLGLEFSEAGTTYCIGECACGHQL